MDDKDTPNGAGTRVFFVFREYVEEYPCPGRKKEAAMPLNYHGIILLSAAHSGAQS
ncbi:MAG: hypothetical protein LBD67_07065 [Candidatus Accumulibacter sp.]|jgi:hypothetical protein|nr:hypothetical protein [Accumulibacter sp.]